jgi:hypothetical protein
MPAPKIEIYGRFINKSIDCRTGYCAIVAQFCVPEACDLRHDCAMASQTKSPKPERFGACWKMGWG